MINYLAVLYYGFEVVVVVTQNLVLWVSMKMESTDLWPWHIIEITGAPNVIYTRLLFLIVPEKK